MINLLIRHLRLSEKHEVSPESLRKSALTANWLSQVRFKALPLQTSFSCGSKYDWPCRHIESTTQKLVLLKLYNIEHTWTRFCNDERRAREVLAGVWVARKREAKIETPSEARKPSKSLSQAIVKIDRWECNYRQCFLVGRCITK